MRLNGEKVEGLNEELIVIPRNGKNLVFRARAINNYDEFDKLVPIPKPPTKIIRGGKRVVDADNVRYKKSLEDYSSKRTNWMILKSLQATEALEWETIKLEDPETWNNFEKEMRDSGFSEFDLMKIIQLVMSASNLDDAKLDRAREDFLLFQEKQVEESSYQREEQDSMQSGEPVNDLV